MNQDMILHLFGWDEKFFLPFRDLIRKEFSGGLHRFIVYGDMKGGDLRLEADTLSYSSLLKNFLALSKEMRLAKKIILHGLFNNHLFYILLLNPWLLKKCHWVIWGGDLYIHETDRKDWRWRKDEFLRKFVISRIGYLVTYVPGDVELARKWYGAKGRYIECLVYPSNVFKSAEFAEVPQSGTTVLVGNSAGPSNNHFEIFTALRGLKEQNFRLICPLSYGNKKYAVDVAAVGKQLFGDRFTPLLDFMPYQDYLSLLTQTDIAIFAHRRQQGMGNAIALLGMGKKVFMRPDVTPWTFFEQSNVKVFDVTKDLCDTEFTPLDISTKRENRRKIVEFFSDEKLKTQLALIFSGQGAKGGG